DYNSFLLIAAGLALIGGIVFGLYSNRIFSLSYKVENKDKNQSQNSKVKEEEKEEKEQKIAKPNILKRNFQLLEDEIKIYQFEKDLASHAIENILLASKNKSIDIFEKDRLLLKYNDQLKKLNEKMQKIQSEIDVTRLIDLRNDLASLLDNKISDIDEKIKEINFKIETKSKIQETKNQNKKNSNINNNLNNLNHPFDIEETIDANLKSRKVINYKNNNINIKKESVIEAERKKIIDLKDQVLAALNRLDKVGIIKEEIKNNDESRNKIKIGNSFINDNQVKSNYNNNKSSSPLSNILNYSELKFDRLIDAKDFEKDIVKTQSKDKQSLSNDKSMKIKFPLGFIFSKSNKEKEIENKTCDTNTKRKDSLSNILN
ncbi:MAG TPA: hypothetical protein VFP49_02140, partial [Nitrososphaeraceae archaeon]|nr:hypothetical protein [Nitrososphaeraceae archaeon]